MLSKANFLCEIGTEEMPAGYIPPIIDSMRDIFKKKLVEFRIAYKDIEVYATPRRLAIIASGMAASQSKDIVEIKGPPVKAAYDNEGNPTKALSGFLKSNNITQDDISTKDTTKGEYIFAIKTLQEKNTCDIIPSIVEFLVKNIPFPKRMRWSDKKITFSRPIQYFLLLLNNEIVPLKIFEISSGRLTRGHYIQFNRMIEINDIKDYEAILKQQGVLLNHNERRDLIQKGLIEMTSKLGGTLVKDDELLETVTFLTESPYILACEFDKSFLRIPSIILITEMREHQRYFAVEDSNGDLIPYFLVVSNNPPTEYIKRGNERVIAARFSDATFFFEEDRQTRLISRLESLKNVLFHKDLGTIHDKIMRMSFIADSICMKLNIDEETAMKINRAILLCKADLLTRMVFEFTSLQGNIGRVYALLDGEDEEVANAISEHYKPRFQNDELPKSIVSIILSLSDKLDNIFCSFSVGNIPKGSEDPYALRRQANAIIEMLLENEINLALDDILNHISIKYKSGKNLIGKILDFISARARTIFQERGFKYDEIDACLSINYYDFLEIYRREKSLCDFRRRDNFVEMLLSFKRMNNILSIFMQKNPDYKLQFNPELLKEKAEKDLYELFESKKAEIEHFINFNQYTELFELLIFGKVIIDKFFDDVMVMAEDIPTRDNRLALLEKILYPFKNLLDFSKIAE